MAQVLQFPREFFVWLDETGSDNRDQIRKFGYSIRGFTPVCHRFLVRGTRISSVAQGIVLNGNRFFDFIRGQLNATIPCSQFHLGNGE